MTIQINQVIVWRWSLRGSSVVSLIQYNWSWTQRKLKWYLQNSTQKLFRGHQNSIWRLAQIGICPMQENGNPECVPGNADSRNNCIKCHQVWTGKVALHSSYDVNTSLQDIIRKSHSWSCYLNEYLWVVVFSFRWRKHHLYLSSFTIPQGWHLFFHSIYLNSHW